MEPSACETKWSGNGSAWRHSAERSAVRKLFDGKELFTGLMSLYAGIYKEIIKSL
jgi:hypothetical protein